MKKPALFLVTLVCIGTAQFGLVQASFAQPAPPDYRQVLVQTKQDIKDKEYEAAEEESRQMLALAGNPEEKGSALIILGESFYRRKMYEQARAEWSKVLTLEAKEDDEDDLQTIAHMGLAKSYSAEGQFDKAIPEYKAVITSCEEEDKEEEADKKEADDVKKVNGLKAVFLVTLANAYFNTKQLDLAQEQLDRAMGPNPDTSLNALTDLTRTLALTCSAEIDMEHRQFKKSLDKFNQVLALVDKLHQMLPTPQNDTDTAPKFKEYVQKQIEGLNKLIPLQLGEGEINSHMAFRVKRPNEFDDQIDNIFQTLIDDVIFESAVQTLGTDD